MDGKDKADNLSGNCKHLFKRVQQLEDGIPVTVMNSGKTHKLKMSLHYSADMASHWALFQAGGVGNALNSRYLDIGMRVTEWLLLKVQASGLFITKKITQLNQAWKESGAQYQMNLDKTGAGTYYKFYNPSCGGRKSTEAVIRSSSSEWVKAMIGDQ
eukprot:gene11594-13695_t